MHSALITGASGFVGKVLCVQLLEYSWSKGTPITNRVESANTI